MSSDAPKKTDEPAVVQAIAGPYAGQRLTMSKADADAAVADKWAVDPSAPPRSREEEEKAAKEAKPLTEEERAEIKAKAEKAARKLRGEPEPEEPAKPAVEAQPHRETTTQRDLGADKPSGYPTRDLGRK
jgi:hypothetical protein